MKVPLSSHSPCRTGFLVGTFYFSNEKGSSQTLLEELMHQKILTNGERYLDSIVTTAMAKGYSPKLIPTLGYYCWGTPEALQEYKYWQRYFEGTSD